MAVILYRDNQMNQATKNAFRNLSYEAHEIGQWFTSGCPIDAPEIMPAGSVFATEQFALLPGSALRIGAADKIQQSEFTR
jgi:hypothetical protein